MLFAPQDLDSSGCQELLAMLIAHAIRTTVSVFLQKEETFCAPAGGARLVAAGEELGLGSFTRGGLRGPLSEES